MGRCSDEPDERRSVESDGPIKACYRSQYCSRRGFSERERVEGVEVVLDVCEWTAFARMSSLISFEVMSAREFALRKRGRTERPRRHSRAQWLHFTYQAINHVTEGHLIA